MRAWRDTPPKHLTSATEAEQRRLLGAVYTKPTSHEQPYKHTAVRQMELGVEADFLASVSKADLAVFLAVLTEMYWARGRANLCLVQLGRSLQSDIHRTLPTTIHHEPYTTPQIPWYRATL